MLAVALVIPVLAMATLLRSCLSEHAATGVILSLDIGWKQRDEMSPICCFASAPALG